MKTLPLVLGVGGVLLAGVAIASAASNGREPLSNQAYASGWLVIPAPGPIDTEWLEVHERDFPLLVRSLTQAAKAASRGTVDEVALQNIAIYSAAYSTQNGFPLLQAYLVRTVAVARTLGPTEGFDEDGRSFDLPYQDFPTFEAV